MPNATPSILLDWEVIEIGQIRFWIASQPVRGFGIFTARNGIRIASYSSPEWVSSERVLYTLGDEDELDNTLLNASLEDFNQILDAISEFNSYHARGNSRVTYRNFCRGTCGVVLCDECKKNYNLAIQFEFGRE